MTITLRIVTRLCSCAERFSLSRLILLVSWPSALLFWFSLMALILFVAAVNDQPTVCSLLSTKRYLVELVEARIQPKRKAYIGLHQVAKNTTALTRSPYQLYMVICQFCIFSLFLENQLMLL